MRKAIRRTVLSVFVGFIFAGGPLFAETKSLSDFSTEGFEGKPGGAAPRNPFVPGATGENSDPSLLNLDGIITGPQAKLALISGHVLREGQKIGAFFVKEIKPGSVSVQSVEGMTSIPMAGYISRTPFTSDQYEIVFRGADLKDALHMISEAGNFNIIAPESLTGRVSLIFHDISLKEALGSILRSNNLEYAEEGNIIRVGTEDSFSAGVNFSTEQIRLHYANAKDLADSLKEHLSDKGTVTSEKRTNTLIIKDNKTVVENIKNLVTQLDREDTQIRIEAKIVDVTRNFSRSLGVQWGFAKDTGQVQGFGSSSVGNIAGTTTPANFSFPAVSPTSGMGILVGNLFSNTDLNAQLTMAEAKGDAHIISQPSISTVNNTPAKIRSGLKIYVKTTSTISIGSTGGGGASAADTGLKEIDTGIELTVTPQITSDNTIKMKIDAVESEADFTRTVDGIPAVIDNTASTTVLVKDGETTVIGGLIKVKKTNTKSGVPFVSSVPFVGWLFKSRTKTRTDNELLVFITPHIINKYAPQYISGSNFVEPDSVESEKIVIDSTRAKKSNRTNHKYGRIKTR